MKAIESVILEPIRKDLIGHTAMFRTKDGKYVKAENITGVDLDGYGRTIRVTADKITYRLPGHREDFETKQYRFHVTAEYSVSY